MPDLTLARATMDATFADDGTRCSIVNDPEAETDDFYDDVTHTASRAAGDTVPVYDGPCMIRPVQGLGQQSGDEGESAQFLDMYRLRIPVDDTVIPIGAVATITVSPNDPSMTNRQFTVTKRLGGSLAVSRIMLVQERTRGPRV